MKIWANTIVYNEENFIWFAIMSVIDYVDKVLVWDTGSTDKTVEIINEIIKTKGEKIIFKQVGKVDGAEFSKKRQAMLEESDCDWILVLDGDEIWRKDSIEQLVSAINKNGDKLDAIVSPFYNLVGDIYHYQVKAAGRYNLLGKRGHFTIRAINRKIPGLHIQNPYGSEGYFDGKDISIQDRDPKKLLFLDAPFIHATRIRRTSKNQKINKVKYEMGIPFPKDFIYPEVLFKTLPKSIPSPWKKRSLSFELISMMLLQIQFIRRKLS